MRALCWHGKEDIRCETVPDPSLVDGRDAIIRVTSCAICGSDLHLMGGFVAGMKSGDIMGHETMGEVVEIGQQVESWRPRGGLGTGCVFGICRDGLWKGVQIARRRLPLRI